MEQWRCKNILELLSKIFWNFCLHIKNDAKHSITYCFCATFVLPVTIRKNSLISCKMRFNQFVSGIVSGIISGIVFAWDQSQWLGNIFSSLRGCSPKESATVCRVVCPTTGCEREKHLSIVCERENKQGKILQSFSSPSTCNFCSLHQVQAKWSHYTNTESGSLQPPFMRAWSNSRNILKLH